MNDRFQFVIEYILTSKLTQAFVSDKSIAEKCVAMSSDCSSKYTEVLISICLGELPEKNLHDVLRFEKFKVANLTS